MDLPSGRVPKEGPGWLLVATEACGGGTPDLGYFLEVFVFIGIFGVGNKSGGPRGAHKPGARPRLVVASGLFWPYSDAPWVSSGP